MFLTFSPGIYRRSPGTFTFNVNIVNTSNDSSESCLSPSCSPRISYSPVLDSIFNTVSYDRNFMSLLHSSCGIMEDSTSVVVECRWDSNSTGNRSSLVDFLNHVLFTMYLAEFLDSVHVIFRRYEAGFVRVAIFAHHDG